jgi:hypothetical protein
MQQQCRSDVCQHSIKGIVLRLTRPALAAGGMVILIQCLLKAVQTDSRLQPMTKLHTAAVLGNSSSRLSQHCNANETRVCKFDMPGGLTTGLTCMGVCLWASC